MAKLLIVDDSVSHRDTVKEILDGLELELVEAASGLEGLNKIKEDSGIDLVVTDFNMPEMDGLEMVRQVRGHGNQVPVMMVTTEFSAELRAMAKDLGIIAWVVKPLKKESFSAAVQKCLARAKK